ncbi:MAG: protein kinase [Planctomycetaceae bacterium]|nr:protein kinase [Planctomycetaceae bacterium]
MLVDIVCQCGRSTRVDDTKSAHCVACGKTLSFSPTQTVTSHTGFIVADAENFDTVDSRLIPSTVAKSSGFLGTGSQIDDLQTTVFIEKETPPSASKGKSAALDPLLRANRELQGDEITIGETLAEESPGADFFDDHFSIHADSTKFCTHAERILNADPFYRITRAKRSKCGPTDSSQGFVYGIHRLVRSHAKGGMGMVHIATDQFLKREVALKELFRESTLDESIVHRFIVEAEITAQLEHPGIIPVHALGLDLNGNPYYTMKLVRGKTFQEAIKQYFKEPSEQELKRLVRRFVSVCQTMAFVHSKGVIHRDLKPANIMLSDHGETLVMDWGIAKAYDKTLATESGIFVSTADKEDPLSCTQSHPDLTLAGTVVGTPAFMSPEQASPDSQEVGPISDVFSLGAILFYLLTGRNAYTGKTSQEILTKVLTMNPPHPSDVARNIPPGLEAICIKAMSRNVRGRYQSANELVADLCNWLDDEPISAMRETVTERAWRYFRKNRQMSMNVFLIVLILLVISSLSLVLLDRGWQRTKIYEQYNENVFKPSAEIGQDILELTRELGDKMDIALEEGEKYRNSDNRKFQEAMASANALKKRIAERAQGELQIIKQTAKER